MNMARHDPWNPGARRKPADVNRRRNIASILLWLIALVGLTQGARAVSAEPLAGAPDPVSFVTTVAQSGMLNLEAARLALRASANGQVRNLAQRMIDDQSRMDDQLAEVGRKRNVPLPTQLELQHADTLNSLKAALGQDFDTLYAQILLKERAALADLLLDNLLHPDTEIAVFSSYNLSLIQYHRRLAAQLNPSLPLTK